MKESLKYLIYDELNTYKGRQGADVSLLNRKVQALAKNELIFIGTSATMASHGSPEEKKEKVVKAKEATLVKEPKETYGQVDLFGE